MGRKAKWGLWTATSTVLVAALLWMSQPSGAARAIEECLRPTAVKIAPIPKDCVPTDEAPPANLMRIVDNQMRFYHLTLQKVVVCETARTVSQSDLERAAFPEDTGKRWLPLYVGCCSYQFRRHVVVVVADTNEHGSVIVQAALVQNRWDYVRSNWSKKRGSW